MARWSVMDAKVQERLVGGVGAALMTAAIGTGLVLGLHVSTSAVQQGITTLLSLAEPPPPPPPKPPIIEMKTRAARQAPAPPGLHSKATPIVAKPPIIALAPPPPVITAARPGTGNMATAGASDRAGPGTGAGGQGDGLGGGGDGDGGPSQIKGRLRYSDMPAELRAAGIEATVVVSYTVRPDGRVSNCRITRSSGKPTLDATTCQLIEQRFRFRPARDNEGRAVTATIVDDRHNWLVDRSDYDRGD